MTTGGIVHLWEHRDALKRIEMLESENRSLRSFREYLVARIKHHVLVVNEHLPNGAFIASAILDDLDDANTIAMNLPRHTNETKTKTDR